MSGERYRGLLTLACLALMLGATGCGGWSRVSIVQVEHHFAGDQMLFIVGLPRVLPDGTSTQKQRTALLKDLADVAGACVIIEGGMGDWRYTPSGGINDAPSDLLLVQGPSELVGWLHEKLRTEFKEPQPMVVPIPSLAVRQGMVYGRSTRRRGERARPPAGE
jgi:hypothetical protein